MDNGRYVVHLPFNDSNIHLGESRSVALKRLLTLESKLNKNPGLKKEYTQVIDEYKRLNHISLVNSPEDDGFYMPHHAVVKNSSNTTKVRVVFDASAKSKNGVSLNDALMIGPTLQDKIFTHLIRFRTYNYVITADIEKMYRQVLIHDDDRRFQRILWREEGEIRTYQLNTLTFGVSSSPYLAIRTLHQLADDEGHSYPNAAEVLKNHMYVDDLLTGGKSIEQVRAIRNEIIALLSRGGFPIRQWASNDARIINDLPNHALHASYVFADERNLKTLGISWNTRDDKIYYSTHAIKITGIVTKRKILSEIAKIFDPIGLLGPVVLYAKRLIQDVWKSGVQWDESIPQSIYTEWTEYTRQLESLNQITFDRKLFLEEYCEAQLHGFCDASVTGYGACVYVRSVGREGGIVVRLLCAKSRVAPLKTVTIPRLELCGALLLARLYKEVISALNIKFNKIIFWCDSTIVLHWLRTPPHALKTYVANRVAAVQEITNLVEWRHIRTENNPADAISRGQLPHAFLQNNTWTVGPSWLSKGENAWPHEILRTVEIIELRKNICLTTTTRDFSILERYSSYSRSCRVVAYCLRFRPKNTYKGLLSPKEINEAEIQIIRLLQASQFPNEFKKLNNNQSHLSRFANLNPFIDKNGLLRVGGRLQTSELTYSQKHPILLPSRNRITDQIIREIHERYYHTGIQTTLYTLRQRFWLLDGRNQAIHLETVSDLSSEGFLAALRRFVARKGLPNHIYSDNGTNFVGANNQLKELYALFNSNEHKELLNKYSVEHRVSWHFIPPAAPHFGGLWESTVKIFKHHLKRVVGDLLFTFEEFNTFIIEIEGILNSRPITALSSDPNDLLALTPAHYLIGRPIISLPEGELLSVAANRLSTWQHITKVRQNFWSRWQLEYLNELQKRSKWSKGSSNIKIGTIVLIKERNLPSTQWILGRISKIYPGDDGIVRVADVKTAHGLVRRATKYLCPLPVEQ
ncbi:uncharacterized protein LOC118647475 [Monomorium pharaonis]|uniref:uncharacterized protein LOC118647475 n=1 Tax=Monomorium pharaonis TaxID=307658 RepID=UPI0017473278|nr:uncharacterized protein LOC118647475 [Monomorium pharaonis]